MPELDMDAMLRGTLEAIEIPEYNGPDEGRLFANRVILLVAEVRRLREIEAAARAYCKHR